MKMDEVSLPIESFESLASREHNANACPYLCHSVDDFELAKHAS